MKELFTAIFEFFTVLLTFTSHKRNLRAVESIVHIYSAMKELVFGDDVPITQCAVFKAENGGRQIKPGSQLYLSCLYEEFRAPSESSMRYQRVHIDGDYMKILLEAMQTGSAYYKTDDLRPDSLARTMNELQNVVCMRVYYLYDKKGAIYYCIVGTDKPDTLASPGHKLDIEVTMTLIRHEVKKTV